MIDLYPRRNEFLLVTRNTVIQIMEGRGSVQVDFKNYRHWRSKLLFLEKGQVLQFLGDGFRIRKYAFEDDELRRNRESRVLFKHLLSLGYVRLKPEGMIPSGNQAEDPTGRGRFLDQCTRLWHLQNPFKADRREYRILFDIKETIDEVYRQRLTNAEIFRTLQPYDLNPQAVFTSRLGITIRKMLVRKRLVEIKKELALTGKGLKEIAARFGYRDPAYFHRIFKESTGLTPSDFRSGVRFTPDDSFMPRLLALIEKYHREYREVGFYARKLNMSSKTLSRRVKKEQQVPVGKVIREKVMETARSRLAAGYPVAEVAHGLHFEEPHHFSAFFKKYAGQSPTA